MKCPHCSNKIMQKSGQQTKVRLQGPIVIDEKGEAIAKCYWCKQVIRVPLVLPEGLEISQETFLLRK